MKGWGRFAKFPKKVRKIFEIPQGIFIKILKKKKQILYQILFKYNYCDTFQEKVTYVGKINFEFSTKLGSEHPYQHVPEENKVYCSIEPEN